MTRAVRLWALLLSLAVFMTASAVPVFAHEKADEKELVRVGVSDFVYLSNVDDQGNRTGILYDYLNEISKYAGWELEYVDCSPEDALALLQNGEVDIIGAITKTEQTRQMFDLSEINIGYVYSALVVKKDRVDYIATDYSTLNGMRVAVYKNAVQRQAALDSFCTANGIFIEKVYCETMDELYTALDDGKADALLLAHTDMKQDQKLVTRFAPIPYYFAVTKGNTEILRSLNTSMDMILSLNPDYERMLFDKYFKDDTTLSFTRDEQAYIAKNNVLRVVFMPNWQPVSFYDTESGTYSGIAVDYMQSIAETTGFSMQYLPVANLDQAIKMLQNGEADVLGGIYDTQYLTDDLNLGLSRAYYHSQVVTVQKKGQELEATKKQRLALTIGFDYSGYFNNADVTYYSSVGECIDAVKQGKADVSALSFLAADLHLRQFGTYDLQIVPFSSGLAQLGIAYSANAPWQLISILDKAVYAQNDAEVQSIIVQNTATDSSKITLRSYIYSNTDQVLLIIVTVSALMVLGVFLVMRMRLRYSQQEAIIGEAYRIVGEMSNEYLFEYDFSMQQLRLPEVFCEKTGIPTVIDAHSDGIAGSIFEEYRQFVQQHGADKAWTMEFDSPLADGGSEWFRATCSVLLDKFRRPLRGLGKIVSMQSEIVEKRDLERKANTDGLTGLCTRRYCERLICESLSTAPPTQMLCFVMVDLDHFKEVNDSLGHQGGDEVLKYLAQQLQKMGDEVLCGRWGGDEFMLFFKDASNSQALEADLQSLCRKMNRLFEYENEQFPISVSIGAALGTPEQYDFNKLLRVADTALYDVKNTTRNGYKIVTQQ